MRIGELARQSGLTIRAIRYYDELGLLNPAAKTQGNYRLYDQESLKLIKTIQRCKRLGMSLSEIAELKGLYTREEDCTGHLRERFLQLIQERMQQIDRQIEELTILKEEISFHYRQLKEFMRSQTSEGLNRTRHDTLCVPSVPVSSARCRG
ncbi:MAG: MerR family transcriptional regulator [Actinobacteria bacterium]|nr:MerR family transcriptional regulator [Actinomycetota bacterium]